MLFGGVSSFFGAFACVEAVFIVFWYSVVVLGQGGSRAFRCSNYYKKIFDIRNKRGCVFGESEKENGQEK